MNTLKDKITRYLKFLTNDIWRITDSEVTRLKYNLFTIIKTVYLTISHSSKDNIGNKASALTYSTLLAIVPALAILFAIARGFGFSNLVEYQFRDVFGSVSDSTEYILEFVDSYLSQAKSGVFIGVGLILLFWTVLNLINNIEYIFNKIWQVNKPRSMFRKITDYFSLLLLMPVFMVVTAGVNIFMSAFLKDVEGFMMLAPFLKFLVRLAPFVLTWIMFTALYVFMPNTKVKVKPALIAGVLSGTFLQLFQMLYISGQVWVTRYNAIYGSFAAIPLLLLWLQVSWTICLYGVELAYAIQNVHAYSFDKDIRSISRRYFDGITILIMSLIAKRFYNNEKPYTAEELSTTHSIPINLTNKVLYQLQEIDFIHEVLGDNKSDDTTYLPSMDSDHLTVGLLLERLDSYGSEKFKVDQNEFQSKWKTILELKEEFYSSGNKILLRDL